MFPRRQRSFHISFWNWTTLHTELCWLIMNHLICHCLCLFFYFYVDILQLLVSCFSFMLKFEDSLWISSFIVSLFFHIYIYILSPIVFLGLGCVSWHLVGAPVLVFFAGFLLFPVSFFALSLLQHFVCIWIQSPLVPEYTLVPLKEPFVHLLNV